MFCFITRSVAGGRIFALAGAAVLAFSVSALGQTSSGGTMSGLGSGGTLGISGGGGTSGSSGSFGISGSGGSSTTGLSSGNAFGSGSTSSPFGSTSPFGTGSNTGSGSGTGSRTGQYGNTGTSQGTFFPTPQSANPLGSYYVNPLQKGMLNPSKTATFGQPMYATITATTTGGRAGGGGGGGGMGSQGTTSSAPASPRYTVGIDVGSIRPGPVSVSPAVQADVQTMLSGSSNLSGRKIQVGLEKGMLVLQGKVGSEYDRRLAEGLARLDPRVSSVRNDLQVGP